MVRFGGDQLTEVSAVGAMEFSARARCLHVVKSPGAA